ncbi:DUF4113 domain-containing protein [uncultured Vibrio sp.]|nr:DUF4113 domain-containing protein [uncultured Vibrio sp.]
MPVFDQLNLNARYCCDAVFLGAQEIEQKWSMRRDLITPQYMADWR